MSSTSANTENRTKDANAELSAQVVRANLAGLLSLAISSPLDFTDDQPQRLRELHADAPDAWKPAIASLAEAWDEALKDRDALTLAYAKLFLGPFEILASPYASFYLEPDQRLMGQVSNEVANVYADAGLMPGPGPREAPDHAALEWEFVYFLTHQYVTTGEADWLEGRDRFIRSHLARWMPALCMAVSQAAVHPFYDRWARLVTTILPTFADH